MAFGFLGDIVEEIGDIILPRGTRGASIGKTLGGAFGGPVGGAVGSVVGSGLSSAIASGGKGQEAVSSPTASQMPVYAPESALSSSGFPQVYQPRFAGFPRIPNTTRDIATGIGMGEIMDIIPDINISKYFGPSCPVEQKRVVGVSADGCKYTITRKQQRALREMLKYQSIQQIAAANNIPVDDLAMLASKQFPPKRRGISGSQLASAKRVNNQILNMANKLGYNCTPKTKAQLGCK